MKLCLVIEQGVVLNLNFQNLKCSLLIYVFQNSCAFLCREYLDRNYSVLFSTCLLQTKEMVSSSPI